MQNRTREKANKVFAGLLSIQLLAGSLLVFGGVLAGFAPAYSQPLSLPAEEAMDEDMAESDADINAAAAHLSPSAAAAADPEQTAFTLKAPGSLGKIGLSLPDAGFETGDGKMLKGSVTAEGGRSPLLYGSVQTIPKGTKVDLTLQVHLNSELSQKGQEVFARISRDVMGEDGSKVVLPGKWVAHGFVTRVDKQKRNGRDGFVDVKFDRIISPDGEYEVPFETAFSTKDNELKSAAKVVLRDTKFASIGALGGSIMSVQMTGLPVAISTYGISVGIGAGIGATYGLACAVARKGKICSVYPGDHVQLKLSEPLTLPGFNPLTLESARTRGHLDGLSLRVTNFKFEKDPISEDKRGRLLRVWVTASNKSKREVNLRNLRVVSDMDDIYAPHLSAAGMRFKHLAAGTSSSMIVPFSVDAKNHKYFLVLLKDVEGTELGRTPIN